MAGRFLRREAIVDFVKWEHRVNAVRKRLGLTRHPVHVTWCGCPDPNCGAFLVIRTDLTIPTAKEADSLLAKHKKARKVRKTDGRPAVPACATSDPGQS